MAALAPEMRQTLITPMITLKKAQEIVAEYEGNEVTVTSLVEVGNIGFSYTTSRRVYDITLTNASARYVLLVSPLHSDSKHDSLPSITTTLQALSALLTKIVSCTNVPVPRPVAQDTSGGNGRWDFGWLLLLIPQPPASMSTSILSLASLRPTLSPRQLARVELRLGTYLRALHGVVNEWFGRPVESTMAQSAPAPFPSFLHTVGGGEKGEETEEEDWSKYSWQDTFVLLLEELIAELCEPSGEGSTHFDLRGGLGIDVEELRRYLSRAIGSFLFDDVESPGLIWVTGSEADVLVSLSEREGTEIKDEIGAEADIAYLLPTFSHALWGDPSMESWFVPPGPSEAVNEGYFGGEGSLIVFPRQKTKRVWYTIYLALLVLVEERRGDKIGQRETTGQDGDSKGRRSKVQWAREVIPKCVKALKDAPYY